MFSGNNRISERQAFRLLTYDLLGLSTLLVPSVLGGTAGRDGIFCIALGVAVSVLYLKVLAVVAADCVIPFPDYLEQVLGKICGRLIQVFYLMYLFLLAGYTAYRFSDVVLESLLREESFYLVLALLLVLVFYGLWGGLEGRARVYEILFWFLMIPLFLMMFFALDEVQTDYWSPVFVVGAGDVFKGSYAVFVCMAIVFLVPFLKNYMEPQAKLYHVGRRALLFAGGVHAALYLILLGIFGAESLGTMEYPAVTLMSAVKISGGFLKRMDAFMFAIWFFTLYALLSGCIFYGGNVLVRLAGHCLPQCTEQKKQHIAVTVLLVFAGLLAVAFYREQVWMECCEWFLWYVGTPVLVAIPVFILIYRYWKKQGHGGRLGRSVGMFFFVFLAASVLMGCNTVELEDRNFPIELAVQDTDNFPQEFLEAQSAGNRRIDYSHLKVVILSQAFVENTSAMQEFLAMMEEKNEIPRNTYVVVAADAEEIMDMEQVEGESVGNYLEQMFENVSKVRKQAYPTIGMLYQESDNQCETLFIPYVKKDGDKLVVENYYVWKRGAPAGNVDSETARLSLFTQNQMEKYQLTLAGGEVVSLSDAHNAITFDEKDGAKTVTVTVKCIGEVLNRSGELTGEEQRVIGRQIEVYMNELAESVLSERAIDVTDSFRKLDAKREWYFYYLGQEEVYEQDILIQYETDIDWVNL